jgi:ribosomal protein L32
MRHTSSHTKNRRSHHALTASSIVTDKESGALRLPHRLDETTGMYRGKQILPKKVIKAKKDHDKKVSKAKEEHAHEHAEGSKEPIHSEKETKKSTGVLGRMTKGKAKARSGMGGGV